MAIYHHSVSIVKRSAGKSAVAAAAYRAGDKLRDELTGLLHNYNRKSGVDYSMILSPVESDWISDREKLWNKVEATEKRYDARLAREVTLAIPHELSRDNQIALVEQYAKINYVDRGMIADLNLHHLDGDNPHAHVMLTMRELKIDKHGQVEFGNKNRDWDNKAALIEQRQSWERLANKYLADAGYDQIRIDCRTLQEQGVNRIPQVHLGCHATSMRARGIPTRIGDEYDRISLDNADLRQRLEQSDSDKLAIVDLDRECEKLNAEISIWEVRIQRAAEESARIERDLAEAAGANKQQNENDKDPFRRFFHSPTPADLLDMIGNDRAKRIVQWYASNLIIPDGQSQVTLKFGSKSCDLSAEIIDSHSIAFVIKDTDRYKRLQFNCRRSDGAIVSMTGTFTPPIHEMIKRIDSFAAQGIKLDAPAVTTPEIIKAETVTPQPQVTTPEIIKVEIATPQPQVTVAETEKNKTAVTTVKTRKKVISDGR